MNEVGDNTLALTNRCLIKSAYAVLIVSCDARQKVDNRRNWIAAVNRKSSGVKRTVSMVNREAIHSGAIRPLEQT